MAFPAVVTTNESALTTAGTAHTVNLPASIAAGDLLVVLFAKGAAAATVNAITGWTELVDENLARGFTVLVRTADGAEGATLSVTTSAATKSAHISYRISGAAAVATQAPQLSTVATGTSTAPNATTVTPTGGAKDYLFISFFDQVLEAADDDLWVTSAPMNYTNLLMKTAGIAGSGVGVELASAQRQLNAASEDAGAFTSTLNLAWRAYTLAVHPSTQQSVSITNAAETDAAQGLSFIKTILKTLGFALETDTAQALSVTKTIFKTLTVSSESDVAQPLSFSQGGAPQNVSILPALESDLAQPLTFTKTIFKTLGPGTESDLSQALSVTKTIHKLLVPASEIDAAQTLSVSQAGSFSIVPALETDIAVPLSVTHPIHKLLTPATEIDTAVALNIAGAAVVVVTRRFGIRPKGETAISPGEADFAITPKGLT